MSDFLQRVLEAKREEVARRGRQAPGDAAADDARDVRDFEAALRRPGLSVIAEIKRRSPSKGPLRLDLSPAEVARTYETHGAQAVSVLTDERYFGGSLDDLVAARGAVKLPVLRKDFVIDPSQIDEARRAGADAVLLIVRILTAPRLKASIARIHDHGMSALVEVHGAQELDTALGAGARIVGVNNRDLDTLEVDPELALRLAPRIPETCVSVCESGIRNADDARRAERAGFDAILVGEALMRAGEPGSLLAALRGAGTA